jgi:hypothetical protein
VLLLTLLFAGVLSLAIPSIADWAAQGPFLTLTLQRKLEGLRKSIAVHGGTVEQGRAGGHDGGVVAGAKAAEPAEKVVVPQSLAARPARQHHARRDPADRLRRRARLHAARAIATAIAARSCASR